MDQREGRDLERLEPTHRRRSAGRTSRSPLAAGSTTRWKALTSTPPVKISPSARQTSARASEPSTSSRQAHQRLEGRSPNRFSGGFEHQRGDRAVALERIGGREPSIRPRPRIWPAIARDLVHRRRVRGPRAASADRPRSAGSTCTWKWKTVCQAAAPQELRMLKPSGRTSPRFAPRAAGPRASSARGPRRRSPTGRRNAARNHQRVAAGRRVDVHEGERVLVLVDDLRRSSPATIPQKMQSASAIARAAYLARVSASERDRIVGGSRPRR